MDIIVIRDGTPTIERHERIDHSLLKELIGAERLQAVLLESPVDDRAIAAYFDEEGGERHRRQNILLPGVGDIRGPLVLVALDAEDRETGLLPEELTAYDLVATDTHHLKELTAAS